MVLVQAIKAVLFGPSLDFASQRWKLWRSWLPDERLPRFLAIGAFEHR